MGKYRHGKNGRPDGPAATAGYQLPAAAWAEEESAGQVPEQGQETAPQAAAAPEAPEAPGVPGTAAASEIGAGSGPASASVPAPAGAGADAGAGTSAGVGVGAAGSAGSSTEIATVPAPAGRSGGAPPAPAAPDSQNAGRSGRFPKPMIAAAATAGAVLIGLPLLLSPLGGGGDGAHHGQAAAAAAGYDQQGDGGDGFVPTADAHGNVDPGASPRASSPPAEPAPNSQTPAGTDGGAPVGAGGGSGGGDVMGAPAAPPGNGGSGGTTTRGGGSGGTQSQQQSQSSSKPQNRSESQGGSQSQGQPQSQGGSQSQGQPPAAPPAAPPQAAAPAPAQARPNPAPSASAPPAPPTYRAVTGASCTNVNAGTGFQQFGWYDKGESGWVVNSKGGYSGDGCQGKYSSMPMSGDAKKDYENSALWTFSTGQVKSGSCKFSVYVPDNGDVKAVGGAPAYYTVQSGTSPGSGTSGSFTVDQVGNRGRWVGTPTFPVSNGRIAVMLHDRGNDWEGSSKTAHLAAAAIRADCTG